MPRARLIIFVQDMHYAYCQSNCDIKKSNIKMAKAVKFWYEVFSKCKKKRCIKNNVEDP